MFSFLKKKIKKKKREEKTIPTQITTLLKQWFIDEEKKRYNRIVIVQGEIRTFYDCTYDLLLYSSDTNNVAIIKVVRMYGENVEGFIAEVKKCTTLEELRALDEKEKIYYD